MILSSRWPFLLCLVTLLLGLLGPVLGADKKTSDVFNVLTKADGIGGECDDKLPQVNTMILEVKQLVDAAIKDINAILKGANVMERKNTLSMGIKRARILWLARQIFGADFNLDGKDKNFLALENSSRSQMEIVRERFQKIQEHIESPSDKYRFSCGDSWAKKVEELQTPLGLFKKGKPIKDVEQLSNPLSFGEDSYEYAFFDKGGPKFLPQQHDEDDETQIKWYISGRRWNKEGPCKGVTGAPNGPIAETRSDQKMIYFCPKAWKAVSTGKWKEDLTKINQKEIPVDGTAHLDNYQSPGSTLLHEMTHQLLATNDNLGYDWKNVHKGRKQHNLAANNADSYTYFAVAAYLSQVEWHSGVAKKIGTQEQETHTKPGS